MSSVEIFEYLSQKYKPLSLWETKRIRQKLMSNIRDRRLPWKESNSQECEKTLIDDLGLQRWLSPKRLVISNMIINLIMSQRTIEELRKYITINPSNVFTEWHLSDIDSRLHYQDEICYNTILRMIRLSVGPHIWPDLDLVKRELLNKCPPVSNDDLDFLIDYVKKILQEKKGDSSGVKNKVSEILHWE